MLHSEEWLGRWMISSPSTRQKNSFSLSAQGFTNSQMKEGSSSRISTSLWDYNRQSSTGKTHRDSRSSNNAHERDNHHLKLTHHQGHCCLHRVRLPKFQTTRPSLALGAKISAGLPALIVDWLMSNLAYASRHYTSKEKSMLDCLSLSSVSEKIETTYFC